MSIKRIGVLLNRELIRGPKNFLFIFAIAVPLVISLVVSLLFGTLFSERPKLGVADEGASQIGQLAQQIDSVVVKEFGSDSELRQAVVSGAVDVGMVLPAGFDDLLASGQKAQLGAYIWGESLMKNRIILGSTIAHLLREVAGHEPPVEVVTTSLGGQQSIPWSDRLVPFIVLMAVMMGGIMVPATSLIDEKQKRTLTALVVTPTSLGEVFVAKGSLGVILSVFMAMAILGINRAFGSHPFLLAGVLVLGAIMSAALGVMLGFAVKDINTLFATIKGLGIFLYAPALVYLFPKIPAWVGRLFPTYYFLNPVVEISQTGAGWSQVAAEVTILLGLIAVLIAVIARMARQSRLKPA